MSQLYDWQRPDDEEQPTTVVNIQINVNTGFQQRDSARPGAAPTHPNQITPPQPKQLPAAKTKELKKGPDGVYREEEAE